VEAVRTVLPVDLAGRGDEDPGSVFVGLLEDDLRASDVGGQAPEGVVHDELDAHGGGQVEDGLAPPDHVVDHVRIEDRSQDELEIGLAQEVLDVRVATGGEVVQGHDGMALFQQVVGQVRGDEAGASGDEDPHRPKVTATAGEKP
jgi:hypothetical protein